jgi:hypothetical protein
MVPYHPREDADAFFPASGVGLLENLRELPSKVIDPNWLDTLEGDGPPSQPVEAGRASGSKGRSG